MESMSVKTERAIVKSKGKVYKNKNWDLIDALEEKEIDITKLTENELPDEFKGKSNSEKKSMLEKAKQDRKKYQKIIGDLAVEREKYIINKKKKDTENPKEDDFGSSVNESIMNKAKKIGFGK